jgi:hypothetical protein
MISGIFDFFVACGGGMGTLGVFCGKGALGRCGKGALGVGGTGAGLSTMVRAPVGPVSFGSTAVGAEDDVAIVALKSGFFPPAGSEGGWGDGGCAAGGELGGVRGVDERKVAFGSKGCSATNRPPSMVQNF